MSAELRSVPFTEHNTASEDFQRVRMSRLSLPGAVARLRDAITANDMWVLHEIDPQMLLRKGGYAIAAARQILFFHPRLMARLLTADAAALIEAPLKFAVIELATAGVAVRWLDPEPAFTRYKHPELTSLGAELAQLCERIAYQALEHSPPAA
jgi:uncharacterized protein (DUF302 family)